MALLAFGTTGLRAHRALDQRIPASVEGRDLPVVGVIEQMPAIDERAVRFVLRVERCSHQDVEAGEPAGCPRGGRVRLSWPAFERPGAPAQAVPPLLAGQRWQLWVRLRRPHATVNPGLFDAELRALEEGIAAVGTVRPRHGEGARMLDAFVLEPLTAIERLRSHVRDRIVQATAGQPAVATGVLVALVVGDQGAIAPRWWERFANTGIAHLMSISGLHVTMIAAVAAWAVGALWRSARVARWLARRRLPWLVPVRRLDRVTAQWLAASVTAFAYCALAGSGIPAQRTCWMLVLAGAAVWRGRGRAPWPVLSSSAAIITLIDPWAPLAAGFWLSFAAVAAIVWAHRQRHAPRLRPGRWREGVSTQVAVTVALVPLGALFFAAFSMVGPFLNGIAIPVVSAFVAPLALVGGALESLWRGAGMPPLWLAAWATRGLLALVEWIDALPGIVQVLPRPGWPALVLAGLACACLLAPVALRWRWWAAGGLLPLVVAMPQQPPSDEIWLTMLDVGQGMAVLVEVGDRRLLYDTGPSLGVDNDAGARTLVPYLRARGIRRLDALVVSHLDDDHSGGALTVLRSLKVDRLIASMPDDHAIARAAADFAPCRRGESFEWGEVRFEWLHPPEVDETARKSATNARSCVLRIAGPAGSALLPGDLERAQELRLLQLYEPSRLAADVLIAPHHGSKTSSSAPFLRTVRPSVAVFQVGYRNRFRHPDPGVVDRYREVGARLLRSDADGAIRIVLKAGQPPSIWRARIDDRRYWRVPVAAPARGDDGAPGPA